MSYQVNGQISTVMLCKNKWVITAMRRQLGKLAVYVLIEHHVRDARRGVSSSGDIGCLPAHF